MTAYHAVRKAVPLLHPGTTCVVIGAGGLGHIGVQCLRAMTATRVVVVDPSPAARDPATELGAHEVFADTAELHDSAHVVLDFVGERGAEKEGLAGTPAHLHQPATSRAGTGPDALAISSRTRIARSTDCSSPVPLPAVSPPSVRPGRRRNLTD